MLMVRNIELAAIGQCMQHIKKSDMSQMYDEILGSQG